MTKVPKIIGGVLESIGFGSQSSHSGVGLALGGGGARGFAHVGVLMALEKFDMRPSVLSGVSAGSIAAVLYGAGLSPIDMIECFRQYGNFSDFTEWQLPKKGLFKLDKFGKLLESWLPVRNLEDMKIPTVICATDFDHARSVGWAKGEIVSRVTASCSIPIIFEPVNINGVNYVDGGVLRNLPAWAIRSRCKTLIGSNCSPVDRSYKYKASMLDIAMRSFQLMMKANVLQDLNLCDYVVQSQGLAQFGTFDMASMKRITIAGYDAACKVLETAAK